MEGWEGGQDKAGKDKTVAPKTRQGASGLGPLWATWAMAILHGLRQQRAPWAFASMGSPGRQTRRGQQPGGEFLWAQNLRENPLTWGGWQGGWRGAGFHSVGQKPNSDSKSVRACACVVRAPRQVINMIGRQGEE